jgi:hypothetical protein
MYNITTWDGEDYKVTSDKEVLNALESIQSEKSRKLQEELKSLMKWGCKYSYHDFDVLSACNGYLREFSEGK